jgi:hypothetical protein
VAISVLSGPTIAGPALRGKASTQSRSVNPIFNVTW